MREIFDGREVRTVAIDPERGALVAAAFRLYATGNYSLSELAAVLEARRLRGRPSKRTPGRALDTNRLSALLRNDYYVGVIRYADKVYEGRHPRLIDLPTFQTVQDVLDAKRTSGERNWRHHHHYLRGSVYCGQCGGRLIYTRAKGHGGTYEYFVCRGRQQGTCTQPHQRVIAVQQAVEDHYRHVELVGWRRDAVRAYVAKLDETAAPERSRLAELVCGLDSQERKLLAAHYADRISAALFNEEQDRIRRERASAEKL